VGPAYTTERIQDPVLASAIQFQWATDHDNRHRAGSGYRKGGAFSSGKGGHITYPFTREKFWVLQPLLHTSEKEWKVSEDISLGYRFTGLLCIKAGQRTGLS